MYCAHCFTLFTFTFLTGAKNIKIFRKTTLEKNCVKKCPNFSSVLTLVSNVLIKASYVLI